MLSKDLFVLMVDFMRKILLIQRKIRSYLIIKDARFSAIHKKFDILQERFQIKRSNTMKKHEAKEENISAIMINEHISKFYKSQLKKHAANMKIYKQELTLAETEYDEYLKENFIEVLLYGAVLEPAPRHVHRPALILLTDATLIEYMNTAIIHFKNLKRLTKRKGGNARSTTIPINFANHFHP